MAGDEAGRWVTVPRRPGLLERWRRRREDRAAATGAGPAADQEPAFGYGRHERPLWKHGHRDEEDIRELLWAAGFDEFGEDQLEGFSVSSGGELPYDVVCITDDADLRTTRLRGYTTALRAAGYRVAIDSGDHEVLRAWPPGHHPA